MNPAHERISQEVHKQRLLIRFMIIGVLLRIMEFVWPYNVSINLAFKKDEA